MARWKAHVNFLLTVIELLSYLLPLTHYKAKRVKNHCFLEGVGKFEPRFPGEWVVRREYFWLSRKLDTFCYLTVQSALCYVQSFLTKYWRVTDRRTFGIASTALAMHALRRTVIKSLVQLYTKKQKVFISKTQ